MMSKQRKLHHAVIARQYTYKVSRKLATNDFHYKHMARWRKAINPNDRSKRQMLYAVYGPSLFKAKRRYL